NTFIWKWWLRESDKMKQDQILVKVRSGHRFSVPKEYRDRVPEGSWVIIVPLSECTFKKASELI
ncbi:MAG: hypothetical protein JSW41_03930, partial [Candidatus Aenigmatarchaeota archaeon]